MSYFAECKNVICDSQGILSALVLSVIPLIRPYQWQSLLMPVILVLPDFCFNIIYVIIFSRLFDNMCWAIYNLDRIYEFSGFAK